ncbi:MAG: LacI family transcriptional regulator [Planctomycetes bacterium]|nr:LacI family transcriptional regulator [Alphaproteobacteria bacterium]MBM4072936.1 LacI family transcriptional regulator [Planctomycetota bacterium]
MSSKPARIKDVARLADASPATVSRVLNASGPVAEETRSRIERVIASLGYVPRFAARQMRGRSHRGDHCQ